LLEAAHHRFTFYEILILWRNETILEGETAMSRIKDYLLPSIQAMQELEMWIGYEEYSKSIDQSPTEIELDRMESDCLQKNNRILSQPINNVHYHKPKGA